MAEVVRTDAEPEVKADMAAEEWYDLLPVEKRLMGWSLGLGIVLLVIFILIFEVLAK
ncbi:MAG: hypothetical protein ACUVSK_11775 [Desulfotomaculales bacterium]